MTSLIQNHLPKISQICEEAGISYLGVFGSQTRSDAREDSDVDLLVEFKETPGLIKFIHTKNQFESVLNRKVDLVTKKGLSNRIRPYVTNDLYQIYG